MTLRNKLFTPLMLALGGLLLLGHTAEAARTVETYSEALTEANEDGIVVFFYGPDWNRRSARMLNSFWRNENTRSACGRAMMLAVPIYQSSSHPKASESLNIKGTLPSPKGNMCPTVMLFDKNGRRYATLMGLDSFGDEQGELGAKSIKEKIAAYHKQQELVQQAEAATKPEEKVRLLTQSAELGIEPPEGFMDKLKAADPDDKFKMQRRANYKPIDDFLYVQCDTQDGFLGPDYIEDINELRQAAMAAANDETLRTVDRQAAYNLYIGALRRQGQNMSVLRNQTKRNEKIDPTTRYGVMMASVAQMWNNVNSRLSPEERRAIKEAIKETAKRRKAKDKRAKQAERAISVE